LTNCHPYEDDITLRGVEVLSTLKFLCIKLSPYGRT